ncbi:response regulator [Paludibacter jiangxiensis]|jgi:two-component system KDP operon response regulator KdpE|uniref:Two-component system, OmpR family n=1 Tax=Paludibacter jiangxiensis TaxID=681398 RepID=A0A161L788_9BACT|nr:response regulator [Paludibacter jiangxiensis]GAT62514.1 two-component system, OmpR family [Paludibacter jiangxiensis]
MAETILIIDDESAIRRLLEITLQSGGYTILEATTGKDGLMMAASHNPHLVILDLGLPDMDGQMVLKKLREWYAGPVIILSVRSSEEDIVKALDSGANDYLTKPFRTGELSARVRSSLRFSAQANTVHSVFTFNNLEIDAVNHIVKKNGEVIKLTSTEFSLLALMAKNAGKVLTHTFILKEIWGYSYLEQTQYLRVFVAQLRKKLEDNPSLPVYIITESGIGYRFCE